jgi:hypothetical protein
LTFGDYRPNNLLSYFDTLTKSQAGFGFAKFITTHSTKNFGFGGIKYFWGAE